MVQRPAFLCAALLAAALPLPAALGQNGEKACENKGFDKKECLAVGCCGWDDGECWSAVGTKKCEDGGGGNRLLPDLDGWADGEVVWHEPPSGWGSCGRVTVVFGVAVCVSKKGWNKASNRAKIDHVAHVFYQLLDNDADGVPDDPAVLKEMVDGGYLLWVPATEDDAEKAGEWPEDVGRDQMTGIFESVPGSCDSPANRGADPEDRSTWAAAVENTADCGESDATTEEILHLITEAAVSLWPDLWGDSFQSAAGAALAEANGDCGWGYTKDWKNPGSNKCTGRYAYNDKTCKEQCLVVEGIYWASISYIGGLYYKERMDNISNEWLMGTPDVGMPLYPKGKKNAASLQEGSPALYGLVSDTTSEGHAWLPEIMPDGRYKGVPKEPDGCAAESKKSKCKKKTGCGWRKKCKLCISFKKKACQKSKGTCKWSKGKCS